MLIYNMLFERKIVTFCTFEQCVPLVWAKLAFYQLKFVY